MSRERGQSAWRRAHRAWRRGQKAKGALRLRNVPQGAGLEAKGKGKEQRAWRIAQRAKGALRLSQKVN